MIRPCWTRPTRRGRCACSLGGNCPSATSSTASPRRTTSIACRATCTNGFTRWCRRGGGGLAETVPSPAAALAAALAALPLPFVSLPRSVQRRASSHRSLPPAPHTTPRSAARTSPLSPRLPMMPSQIALQGHLAAHRHRSPRRRALQVRRRRRDPLCPQRHPRHPQPRRRQRRHRGGPARRRAARQGGAAGRSVAAGEARGRAGRRRRRRRRACVVAAAAGRGVRAVADRPGGDRLDLRLRPRPQRR